MTLKTWTLLATMLAAISCNRGPAPKEYQLTGQIIGIRPDANEMLIKHEDIPGFMAAMTMPYTVGDPSLLNGKEPGDLITATILVTGDEAHLSSVTKTGHATLDVPPPAGDPEAVLSEGDPVPDQFLIDQDGKPFRLASLSGHRVGLTFIYTRCPLPDFCPLMDKNFAAIQDAIRKSPDLADVRLASVSFDPDYDKPDVLKAHAKKLNADPAIWSFLTAGRDDVTALAAKFGVSVEHGEPGAPDIGHTLRTAVLDPGGRVAKVYTGNSWTPPELIAELKAIPAPKN